MDLSLVMSPPASKDLVILPTEILDMILEFIIRPSDLKALCLVSKAVSEPAFRHLYRNIVLPYRIDDRTWVRVDILSQSQHLHHIQSFHIGTSILPRNDSFCKNLQPLLRRLPKNALKAFTYGLQGRPQAEDLLTVWQEQKALRNLQLDFNLCAPSLLEVTGYLANELASLTSIEELEVDFGEEVDRSWTDEEDKDTSALELLSIIHLEKLRSLQLRYAGRDEGPPRGFGTPMAAEPFLVAPCFPRTLTRLSLSFVCLPPPEDWPLSEYHALLALELHDCLNVAPILDSIGQPKLKEFYISRQSARDSIAVSLATQSFLSRFSTLVILSLDIDIDPGPIDELARAIREHGVCLRSLRIEGCIEGFELMKVLIVDSHREMFPQMEFLALPLRMEKLVKQCEVQDQNLSGRAFANNFRAYSGIFLTSKY